MKRIALLSIIFVFIVSSTLAIISMQMRVEESGEVERKIQKQKEYKHIPLLGKNSLQPTLTASSIFANDIDSGLILFEKNADTPILPASTTKIITALVALDYYLLDDVLTVGKLSVPGQTMRLVEGEKITARALLYGLLICLKVY